MKLKVIFPKPKVNLPPSVYSGEISDVWIVSSTSSRHAKMGDHHRTPNIRKIRHDRALGGIFGKYGGTETVQFLGQFGFMADMQQFGFMGLQQFNFGLPGFFGMDLDMTALGDEETLGMIFAYLVPKVCISLIARPETLELLLQFAELELQVSYFLFEMGFRFCK
ncbi:hypothetical protein LXL04_034856 [Taraxacum kok-saghyz]